MGCQVLKKFFARVEKVIAPWTGASVSSIAEVLRLMVVELPKVTIGETAAFQLTAVRQMVPMTMAYVL